MFSVIKPQPLQSVYCVAVEVLVQAVQPMKLFLMMVAVQVVGVEIC